MDVDMTDRELLELILKKLEAIESQLGRERQGRNPQFSPVMAPPAKRYVTQYQPGAFPRGPRGH